MEIIGAFADFGPLGWLLGISLSVNVFILIEFVRGTWTSRKNVEEVQKMADTFQAAWAVSQENQTRSAELLVRMTALADTIEHFFDSLKRVVK